MPPACPARRLHARRPRRCCAEVPHSPPRPRRPGWWTTAGVRSIVRTESAQVSAVLEELAPLGGVLGRGRRLRSTTGHARGVVRNTGGRSSSRNQTPATSVANGSSPDGLVEDPPSSDVGAVVGAFFKISGAMYYGVPRPKGVMRPSVRSLEARSLARAVLQEDIARRGRSGEASVVQGEHAAANLRRREHRASRSSAPSASRGSVLARISLDEVRHAHHRPGPRSSRVGVVDGGEMAHATGSRSAASRCASSILRGDRVPCRRLLARL
jgi:hypothetical protein